MMRISTKLSAVLIIAAIVSTSQAVLAGPPVRQFERMKVPTPISQTGLLDVLRQSHVDVFGHEPEKKRLAMAWAQVALESGRGRAMWNYNIGNVGPAPSHPQVPYYIHSALTRYRSFDTFVDGGRAYWKVLRRCRFSLMAFDVGQPVQAAKNLKSCGYYGADVVLYSKGMTGLYNFAMKELITKIPDETVKAREKVLYSVPCECSRDDVMSPI